MKNLLTGCIKVLLLASVMVGCGKWDSGGGGTGNPDITPPTVSSTSPANGALGVPLNTKLTATFSEAMNPLTITSATFTVTGPGTSPVSGSVSYVGNTATFSPSSPLASNTTFTAMITTGAKDLAGNALANNYIWAFITGVAPDTTAPMVTSTTPVNGALSVQVNSKLTATFSEAMDPSSITTGTFVVTGPGTTPVVGSVSYLGFTATFTPGSNLAANTTFTGTITTGAKDLAGNALATNYVWTFTTGTAPDTTAPMVTSTTPVNGATGVLTNSKLTATFSEAMDPLTITTATFMLTGPGTTPVLGTVTYVGTTATFTPASNLVINTLFTATITTGSKDLAGNALASNYVWTFTTGTTSDTVAPTVTSTTPVNNATGVLLNSKLTATFSEVMDPLTLSTATFMLTGPGTTPVLGAVTYVGTTATFMPAINLAVNTTYTTTIKGGISGAKDLAGNAMVSNYVWTFSTGVSADTTAPTVIATGAYGTTGVTSGATGLPVNRSSTATFSEAMDPLTITTATFTVTGPGTTPVLGAVTYVGTTTTFKPNSNFAPNTLFTSTITVGVTDLAGNHMASNYVWTWSTGAALDTTPPTVTSTSPVNNAIGVAATTTVTATFSKAMDPLTINTATFTLTGPGTASVLGTVTYLNATATFAPTNPFEGNTIYTATITTGAKDQAGNALASNYVWIFTTGTVTHTGPNGIDLGAAGPFNILGGSAVTNTDTVSNPTSINGLVGVYPGSAVSGLPNAIVLASQIHAGDTVAQAAKVALLAAYNDAVSRSLNAISLPGNLGGLTLAPGLYVNSTSSGISGTGANAILTLDAQGDANAVWIFKMGSTWITDPGTSVVLAGGAQAKNVYWQVGSSATLGTNSIFKGNIMAQIAITLNTGVNLQGRALTQTAAVTLDKNTITLP